MNRTLTALTVATACLFSATARADENDDADLVVLDGGFAQLSIIGLLQTQFVPWQGDDALIVSGDPADNAGVRIRRARLGVKGWAWGDTEFELSLQAEPEGMGLLDAWVAYRGFTADPDRRYPAPIPYVIAETVKGFGFPGAGTNAAHNLPLGGNPSRDESARQAFTDAARALFVPPEEIARATADLIERPRPFVRVTRLAGVLVAAMKFVPGWLTARLGSALGTDSVFLDGVDTAARQAYLDRIRTH